LNDGKLRLERRNGAPWIFACTQLQGKYIVRSAREQTLPAATRVATDWYLELRDRIRKRLHGRSLAEMAAAFIAMPTCFARSRQGTAATARKNWSLLKDHSMASK
jgi:hypothetical protein